MGLGTWGLTGKRCRDIVRRAVELGYRHIDTAEIYGNHSEIGEAIRHFPRSGIFLTSKVWTNHLRHSDVIEACNRTLRELKTDYLDLYLIHWPSSEVPHEETFAAMRELVSDGKVRSVGVSNFAENHLRDALRVAGDMVMVDQMEFHPRCYQKDLLEFCKDHGLVVTAYSPLGRGNILGDEVIREIAEKYHRTPAQVCLRWGLQKGVVVIPKAGSEGHLRENLDVFDWEISKDDMRRLDSLDRGGGLGYRRFW